MSEEFFKRLRQRKYEHVVRAGCEERLDEIMPKAPKDGLWRNELVNEMVKQFLEEYPTGDEVEC
jgi:hypothetical protein